LASAQNDHIALRDGLPKPGFPENGICDAMIGAAEHEMGPLYAGFVLQPSEIVLMTIALAPCGTPEHSAIRAPWPPTAK
jgi:hypothetical protein